MTLYLDYNATTPVDERVLEMMMRVYREEFGNAGSRTHNFGQRANSLVEQSRGQIAALFGVDKAEVVFTSGATESNNLAILGLAKWGAEQGRRHIISTSIEHKAVLEPLVHLQSLGFEVEFIPVLSSGRVATDEIIRRLRPDTLLVTMMHANNETGVIQPVDEIGEYLTGTPTFFHIDAAQTSGKLVSELRQARYDLLSVSAHKLYGPQGVGSLILRRRNYKRPPVQPLLYGGGQERGLRPGTLPVALIAGFGKASELAGEEWRARNIHALEVRHAILRQLSAVQFEVNGDLEHQVPHCLNLSFPGVRSEALMLMLQEEIAISNGSACTAAEYKPSHVLQAMGFDAERIKTSVRISWGPGTPADLDLAPLITAIQQYQ